MIERTYALFYYHHQIGSMNYYPLFITHCLGLDHETMVYAVCLYILMVGGGGFET